jgi:mannose-6-phosphate isomerase-like protein (cupin superfamily)
MVDHSPATMRLPAQPTEVAPDGSDVRVLLSGRHGGMAQFELAAGRVSRAIRHRTVEEIWFIVAGRGRMWRRSAAGDETTIDLEPGVCLTIPVGTHFQFRADGDEPLQAIGVTMPPWPGADEAVFVDGDPDWAGEITG